MSVRNFSDKDPDYEVVQSIGGGLLGKLYKMKRRSDGKDMICNEFKLVKADSLDLVRREVAAMRALDDCRYVALWGDLAFDPERLVVHLYMDVDFKPETTLETFIVASKSIIKKEVVAVIINTLAKALVDCHEKGVYHKNIRPRNILLAKKLYNGFTFTAAYLTNFGIREMVEAASISDESLKDSQIAESQCYMAPESLDPFNPTFSAKSDVFALGCTMHELCCRTKAYENTERVNVPQMTAAQKGFYGNSMSPMPGNLMQLEPDKRPDIQTFSATMQAYCESRVVKFKNRQAWISTGVQVLGAVVAAQNPAQASLVHAATKVAAAKVMAPAQALAPAPAPAPAQAQAQSQRLLGAPVQPQPSGLAPVIARGLPQPEPPASVQTLPQIQAGVQSYQQASGGSPEISLQEIMQALLEVRGQAQPQSQTGAQVHPQASELSPADVALGQGILKVLLKNRSQAQPQVQPGVQVHPQASGLVPGWGQALSQALSQVPSPTQQQRQSGVQTHLQTSRLPPGHQKTPSVAFQSQPQTHAGAHSHDQPQAAAQPPTAAQQQAFQMALQAQQAQWQNFGTLMQAQNHTAQTMAAMNANNAQTMHNINSMHQNQAHQQFAQRQQTQAINNANQHLNAQAWGQAIQGNDVIVLPAGQQYPYFYGGV